MVHISIKVKPGSAHVISNIIIDLLLVDILCGIKNNAIAKLYFFKQIIKINWQIFSTFFSVNHEFETGFLS